MIVDWEGIYEEIGSKYRRTLDRLAEKDNMKHITNYDKVREFHTAFKHRMDQALDGTTLGGFERAALRNRLILEEYREMVHELFGWDKKKLAKELADLLYVVYGTAATYGIPIDEVFARVHESNMSKLGEDGKPVMRNDGKVLKGPNYKEPDMEGLGL